MLKLVTICDIEAGLSVLVRVATEAVEDQEDSVESEATILPWSKIGLEVLWTIWLDSLDSSSSTSSMSGKAGG